MAKGAADPGIETKIGLIAQLSFVKHDGTSGVDTGKMTRSLSARTPMQRNAQVKVKLANGR